jgi:hypothetical protein
MILIIFVRVIVMVVWSVVGFFFWIPLLARIITVYTAIVAAGVFSGNGISGANSMLEKASTFYIRGFYSIWSGGNGDEKGGIPVYGDDMIKLGMEIIYSITFYSILFALYTGRAPWGWLL